VNDNEKPAANAQVGDKTKKEEVPNVLVDSRASIPSAGAPRLSWALDFKKFVELVTIEVYSSNSSVLTSVLLLLFFFFLFFFFLLFSAFFCYLCTLVQLCPSKPPSFPLSMSFLTYSFSQNAVPAAAAISLSDKSQVVPTPKRAKALLFHNAETEEASLLTQLHRRYDVGEPLCMAIVETLVPT